ncbi:protein transport protein HofC [Leclercia adecarboxylata]|jgi:protein transport protein HofC|uniref:protein transport protein HofC n=1 Tax=Leclercia TaxID=83654 RepID=UPI000CD074AB|nr:MULTISPECIES: protein transport protein HofC [Leclercia]POV33876.1 type IV pilin biogenesis protein [Leclercia sp. LSNIH5]POW66203.1 type IV pilin biogenesis protein [Leclercia sp. LSNIH2]AUU84102.1 type IV pilin biogenesis protein [Leclercia sp. LSNIH1]MCZ7839493.1 protein transport protein HofC [Leclercia adecarboxylata]MEB5751006.1 protein transport protein HofC [Leclercia adecarboxylata]
MAGNQLWRWRALSPQGERQAGALWAPDKQTAWAILHGKALVPLELRRCVQQTRWQAQHRYDIIHQLATLLQAGLTLSAGLALLAQQHPARQWQALLQSVADDLSAGCAFSDALKKWPHVFPPLYVSMIKTGELTGKLDECCRQLAQQQKTQQQLSAKVIKALRYPVIILGLAFAVVLAMVTLVLPEFAAIYKTFNTPLPALTRAVMGLANVLQERGAALLFSLIAITSGLLFLRRKRRWRYATQRLLLNSPVIGPLVRGQKLSQIFTVLSLTQQAGIAFIQGLESTEETLECPFWQEKLQAIRHRIMQGLPIWSALNEAEIFTPLCIQLVRTGEASGALDTMLSNLAQHHNEQTFQQADNLASLLEPVLLIVTGLIIGTLVVAMYLPIFHLGDAMSAG